MSRKSLRVSKKERYFITTKEWYDVTNAIRKHASMTTTDVAKIMNMTLSGVEYTENLALYKMRRYADNL